MDNIMFIIFIVGITFILYYFCALFWGSLQDIKKEKEDKERQNENLERSTNEIDEDFKNSKTVCKNCEHLKFVKYIKETDTFEFHTDCGYLNGSPPIYCRNFKEREN